MASDSQTHRGIVHGRTIKLDQDTGLPDGQEVVVTVQTLTKAGSRLSPGEGIRRSAGGWSDDSEGLDEFLNWNREHRKQSRPEIAT
jgi:hypothetical protein